MKNICYCYFTNKTREISIIIPRHSNSYNRSYISYYLLFELKYLLFLFFSEFITYYLLYWKVTKTKKQKYIIYDTILHNYYQYNY